MNRKLFTEYYSKMFGTKTFKETYTRFKSLPIEEQKRLTKERYKKSITEYNKNHPERYEKTAEKLRGRTRGPNEKISEKLKKYYSNEANRKKTSEALKKAFSKCPKSRESIEKQRASLRKTYQEHPEIKERISKSVKKWAINHPGEISKKTKAAMEKFYQTDKGKENLLKWQNAAKLNKQSTDETEVYDFIKSIYDGEIIRSERTILDGRELDIYIPEKALAIEYDGLFWHSEYFKLQDVKIYHLKKTLACEEKGIRLIHIFSDEWREKRSIVKSLVASALGIYDKRYFARNLKFYKVSSKEAAHFFEENHIAGQANAKDYFALKDENDEIIQAVSIGKNRFSKAGKGNELIRMATKKNCQVVGGFSKLMKNIPYDEVESYVDRRLFSGKGYLSSGWKLIKESSPRYFYTDGYIRENRMKFMKQRCLKYWPGSDPSKTEHELCNEHGYFQIFDCGTLKMLWRK